MRDEVMEWIALFVLGYLVGELIFCLIDEWALAVEAADRRRCLEIVREAIRQQKDLPQNVYTPN